MTGALYEFDSKMLAACVVQPQEIMHERRNSARMAGQLARTASGLLTKKASVQRPRWPLRCTMPKRIRFYLATTTFDVIRDLTRLTRLRLTGTA